MDNLPEPHRTVLALCGEEQVGLWFIISHVQDFYRGDDEESIRKKTLGVLRDLMKEDYIQAGTPSPDGAGFVPWAGTVDDAIAKVSREWAALGRVPSLGDIAWFAATQAGARRLKRSESSEKR